MTDTARTTALGMTGNVITGNVIIDIGTTSTRTIDIRIGLGRGQPLASPIGSLYASTAISPATMPLAALIDRSSLARKPKYSQLSRNTLLLAL